MALKQKRSHVDSRAVLTASRTIRHNKKELLTELAKIGKIAPEVNDNQLRETNV